MYYRIDLSDKTVIVKRGSFEDVINYVEEYFIDDTCYIKKVEEITEVEYIRLVNGK